MERLTIDEIIEHCDRKTGMYEKACDVKYLETAVMGNGIKEYWEHKQVAEYLKKLKEYVDLEEHGLLLRLPCRVGDKIFLDFAGFGKDIDEFTVENFHLDCFEDGEVILFCDYESDDKALTGQIDVMNFGKTVFITREEAEAKLKELRGGIDDNHTCNCTNADRIRNMSDEELAELLDIVGEDGISSQYTDVPCDCCCEKTECSKCWQDWLQSEAE